MTEHTPGAPDPTREDPVTHAEPAAGHEPAPEPGPPTRWEEGRHPVHVAHLVMGIAFAGLLLVWALLWGGAVDGGDAQWLLPLPWLLAGAAGLAAAARGTRRRL